MRVSGKMIDRRIVGAICLALITASCGTFAIQSSPFQDWRLGRMGLNALQAEFKSNGESSRLLYFIGLGLNRAGRFREAEGYLRQGVGHDPNSARLRDEWARSLLGCGQTTEAFGELREFAGTHPDSADAHFVLGKFYYSQGSMERASQEFERTIALNPRLMQAHLHLAGARDSLHDTAQALTAAARAVELEPDSAEARLCLASLSGRTNQPAAIVRAQFQSAIALKPGSAAAHQEFAQWLVDAGASEDWPLAIEHARRAIDLGSRNSTAYLLLGRALVYYGEDAQAVPHLAESARLAADDPAPALALSQCYSRLKESEQADTWRSSYLLRQKNLTEQSRLMQAVAVAPGDPGRRAALALWLGMHGDRDGCARNYGLALRSSIESPRVLVAAARALQKGGHAELSLSLCRRAVLLAHNSPDAHEALGDALLNLRLVDDAILEYNHAIRLDARRSEPLIARSRRFLAEHRRERGLETIRIVERTTASVQKR